MNDAFGWLRRGCWLMAIVACLGGCARPSGPEVLRLAHADYQRVFDAALEASRDAGMPAVFRDRRGGIIETDANLAGSLLEPWRTDNESLDQVMENTITFQRRKARFEFTPLNRDPLSVLNESAAPNSQDVDLTAFQGEMELRVWVYVERANAPGYRRGAWSRRTATRAELGHSDSELALLASVTAWTPIARDREYEQRMLGEIERVLAQ